MIMTVAIEKETRDDTCLIRSLVSIIVVPPPLTPLFEVRPFGPVGPQLRPLRPPASYATRITAKKYLLVVYAILIEAANFRPI